MATCADKTVLLLAYTNAVKEYSDSISDLHELMPTISRSEYVRLYAVAEMLRTTAEEARIAVEDHVRKHQC